MTNVASRLDYDVKKRLQARVRPRPPVQLSKFERQQAAEVAAAELELAGKWSAAGWQIRKGHLSDEVLVAERHDEKHSTGISTAIYQPSPVALVKHLNWRHESRAHERAVRSIQKERKQKRPIDQLLNDEGEQA